MSKFEAIYRRKSVRNYSEEGLSEDELERVREEIENTQPLHEEINSNIILGVDGENIQKTFSGLKSKVARVDSPHYLIGTSEEEDGYLVNMGYMLEGIVLFLTKRGLGSCWLGSGLNEESLRKVYDFEGSLVIMVAFGDSVEGKNNLRSDPRKAKRKSVEELLLNDGNNLPDVWKDVIDAVRYAPSAVNSQPWRFYHGGDAVHVFIEKKGFFKSVVRRIGDLNKLNRIDAGIALKHLEIAAENFSLDIRFEDMSKKRKGHEYIMSAVEAGSK